MPISTDSEEWQNGRLFDWTAVHIDSILSEDAALTLDEVADKLLEEQPDIVPTTIREDEQALKSYLYRVLERLSRRRLAEDRVVTKPDGTTEVYYTKSSKDAVFPLAEIVDNFPRKFSELEEGVDNNDGEISELKDRLSQLEYQFQEEHR